MFFHLSLNRTGCRAPSGGSSSKPRPPTQTAKGAAPLSPEPPRVRPRDLKLDSEPGFLTITWTDGSATRHAMAQLRKDCPCATCNTERAKITKPGPVLRVIQSGAPAVQEARILEFSPVGRYALSFVFNDGHSTGIYTYDFLRQTGTPI